MIVDFVLIMYVLIGILSGIYLYKTQKETVNELNETYKHKGQQFEMYIGDVILLATIWPYTWGRVIWKAWRN